MKTNKKKRLTVSLLAVVTVLALVLTGCGAENAAEHNKYLKDEVLNSQTVDKETSSADKDKTSASKADKNSPNGESIETDKDSSKSDDKKDSDKSDNKNTGSSSSSSSSSNSSSDNKKPSGGSGNSGSSNSSGSSKPSTGGGSSSSGNKPSTGGGNSGSSSKPTEPSKPEHHCSFNTVISSSAGDCSHDGSVTKKCSCGATKTENTGRGNHNWVTNYKEVHHDAVYEEQPVYEWRGWYECLICGKQFDNVEECGGHCIFVCGGGYTYKTEQVLVRTELVLVQEAYTEQVEDGQICSICGAKK